MAIVILYKFYYYFNILELSLFKHYIHSFTYAMRPEEYYSVAMDIR